VLTISLGFGLHATKYYCCGTSCFVNYCSEVFQYSYIKKCLKYASFTSNSVMQIAAPASQ
jgi:hypothetical protein